jgi:hypothetical protein
MEMPKPTADHRRLEKVAGIWSGTETMHPSPWDPKGGIAQATTRARVDLDGFVVVSDYEQTRNGQRTYAGHRVYTWDQHAKQVVLHWFDTSGQGVDDFRGTWNSDRLTLESKNPMGRWRMTSDYSKAGVATSRMETSPDGATWSVLFEGSYRRES